MPIRKPKSADLNRLPERTMTQEELDCRLTALGVPEDWLAEDGLLGDVWERLSGPGVKFIHWTQYWNEVRSSIEDYRCSWNEHVRDETLGDPDWRKERMARRWNTDERDEIAGLLTSIWLEVAFCYD